MIIRIVGVQDADGVEKVYFTQDIHMSGKDFLARDWKLMYDAEIEVSKLPTLFPFEHELTVTD